MLAFLSPLISGLALSWAIYSFFAKKKEEEASADRKSVMQQIGLTKEILEKRVVSLEMQLLEQQKAFNDLQKTVHISNERVKIQTQVMNKNQERFEKILDKHDEKLDSFGKITVKDK